MAKQKVQVGIDLGTANILVYIAKHGIVFNEPSVVAYDRQSKRCIACGHSAKLMMGKEHDKIKVVRPLEGGVVADLDATRSMLQYIFSRLDKLDIDYAGSTILLCCPSEVTVVERAALIQLAYDMGVRDVFIEQEVKAGAIGAGIDIYSTTGSMIVDIGGGSSDIGVLACGDLVVWESIRVAGNYFDNEIAKHIKQNYNLLIGDRTAERVKFELATLAPIAAGMENEMRVSGRHLSYGLPSTITVKQGEIREIMLRAFERIKHTILAILERTPPELSADILRDGIVVNGGGACIPGIKEYFEAELGLPCRISDNPLTSIVEGTKYLLKNRGNYLVKPQD